MIFQKVRGGLEEQALSGGAVPSGEDIAKLVGSRDESGHSGGSPRKGGKGRFTEERMVGSRESHTNPNRGDFPGRTIVFEPMDGSRQGRELKFDQTGGWRGRPDENRGTRRRLRRGRREGTPFLGGKGPNEVRGRSTGLGGSLPESNSGEVKNTDLSKKTKKGRGRIIVWERVGVNTKAMAGEESITSSGGGGNP